MIVGILLLAAYPTWYFWPGHRDPARFPAHEGPVMCVAFSPQGDRLASGGIDKSVLVRNVDGKVNEIRLEGHAAIVTAVVFSQDGSTLASGSFDGTVRMWEVGTNRFGTVLDCGDGVAALFFFPDTTRLGALTFGGTLLVWEVNSSSKLYSIAVPQATSITCSKSGDLIAFGCNDGTVRVFDVSTGSERNVLRDPSSSSVVAVSFSENGRTLLSVGQEQGRITEWSTSDWAQLSSFRTHDDWVLSSAMLSQGRIAISTGLVTSSYSSWVRGGRVSIWSVDAERAVGNLRLRWTGVKCLAASADGNLLACGCFDGHISVCRTDYR